MKNAYVVACYFGPRRLIDNAYNQNPHNYINRHLYQFQNLKYNFDFIIFVLNDLSFPVHIPPRIGRAKVIVERRENIGMSYGAWNYILQKYGDYIDSMFLIEDDYIPVYDYFEQPFYTRLSADTPYVCSHLMWYQGEYVAAIANGLILSKTLLELGGIPYANSSEYYSNEITGQIGLSRQILNSGRNIGSLSEEYRFPFLNVNNEIICYGEGETLIKPINYNEEKS